MLLFRIIAGCRVGMEQACIQDSEKCWRRLHVILYHYYTTNGIFIRNTYSSSALTSVRKIRQVPFERRLAPMSAMTCSCRAEKFVHWVLVYYYCYTYFYYSYSYMYILYIQKPLQVDLHIIFGIKSFSGSLQFVLVGNNMQSAGLLISLHHTECRKQNLYVGRIILSTYKNILHVRQVCYSITNI